MHRQVVLATHASSPFDLAGDRSATYRGTDLGADSRRVDGDTVADQPGFQPVVARFVISIKARSSGQIQVAIIVVIGPGVLETCFHAGQSGRVGHVRKIPVALVAVQPWLVAVPAGCLEKQVQIAIIVVVGSGRPRVTLLPGNATLPHIVKAVILVRPPIA